MTAPTRRPVGVAIVNWNTGSQLSDCLWSIAATVWDTVTLSDVVIVDNASLVEPVSIPTAVAWLSEASHASYGFAGTAHELRACAQAASSTTGVGARSGTRHALLGSACVRGEDRPPAG